ncbi:hypothetical protein, partial [Actinotalea ferrariae]|uniref:hypothetical protein n=1 Tax=Actinotalea ferrariae TaxID=1386098 RepID=UPI0005599CF5
TREAAAALLGALLDPGRPDAAPAPSVVVGTVTGEGAALLPPDLPAVVLDVTGDADRAPEAVAAR